MLASLGGRKDSQNNSSLIINFVIAILDKNKNNIRFSVKFISKNHYKFVFFLVF